VANPTPTPFRVKKNGTEVGPWKAMVRGAIHELAPESASQSDAEAALQTILTNLPPIPELSEASEKSTATSKEPSSIFSTFSTPSSDEPKPEKPAKPKPGEMRKEGLTELSAARIKSFREGVAQALAAGNVTLDRALLGIFRDNVPTLTPDQHMLLSTGWELACEQYFVSGVPPAWIIILLANAQVMAAMYDQSQPKKPAEPEEEDVSRGTNDAPKSNATTGKPKNPKG
jgi:hypothetical protein